MSSEDVARKKGIRIGDVPNGRKKAVRKRRDMKR